MNDEELAARTKALGLQRAFELFPDAVRAAAATAAEEHADLKRVDDPGVEPA